MTPLTLLALTILITVAQLLLKSFPPSSWAGVFPLYLRLTGNSTFAQLVELKKQRVECHLEKSKLSPQDQYAKWTKLNRKHDALTKQIEDTEALLQGTKTTIDNALKLIPTSLTVILFVVRAWYRKQALFYLPENMFPYAVEYILSWPSTPIGSIGVSWWLYMLTTFIGGLTFIYTTLNKKQEQAKVEEIVDEKKQE